MSGPIDWAAGALRLLPAETAHAVAIAALERGLAARKNASAWPILATRIAGLALPNPVGLAAGFDKDARAVPALARAGFGFVECGTVTPLAQPGNPRPRLFRLSADRGVINRMGFNNAGLDAFAARLARRPSLAIVGANVGANKDSADRVGDYVKGVARLWPLASYVTINISSPNTPGLRGLQERGALEELLGRVGEARARLAPTHGDKPIFLKVAPDLDEGAARDIVEIGLAARIDGLIVSNTTIERPAWLISAARGEAGGLSGRPLFEKSTAMLRLFAQAAAGRLALIGAGGVEDGATALAKIKAGASAVQLYTALAYDGPGLIGRLLSDLAARLKAEGFASVREAVGAA
ncbi:MAG TPA: quinone-dependent dihydroorotate dehydrogenase [Caulobacterales bacterium]|nr:quinone-dependent dihydroorotate dehydrogenase [Caulobacterales bacterium]